MLILDYPEWLQPSIVQTLIPEAAYRPTSVLKRADRLLSSGNFEDRIVKLFKTNCGRPTIPVRVYLRMMFLKYYTGLGYEGLVLEVTRNLMYRYFCRIPVEFQVPHPFSLSRTTKRYGETFVRGIYDEIIVSLADLKQKSRSPGKSGAKDCNYSSGG